MDNLHLTLTYHWYDEIKSGRKKIDYREKKPYWIKRIDGKKFNQVILQRGYSGVRMCKKWVKTEILDSGINTDLKIDKPVYAIYFE